MFVPPNYDGFDGERLLYCGIETDTRDIFVRSPNIESNQFNIYKNGFQYLTEVIFFVISNFLFLFTSVLLAFSKNDF